MTTMRKRHNPRYHDQPAVTVYTTPTCTNCPKTLRVLRDHNISHTVVDVSKDKDAYTYVTQDLGYRAVPVVQVLHQFDKTTWTGHRPELIAEHILAHYQVENQVDDLFEDMAVIGDNTPPPASTAAVIRNSRLGRQINKGRFTGPHLQIRANKEDQT